jgi:hypothetical protein
MQLTEQERRYIQCLSVGMTFEQMMAELNMGCEELGRFGPALLDRILEAREPMPFNMWIAKSRKKA